LRSWRNGGKKEIQDLKKIRRKEKENPIRNWTFTMQIAILKYMRSPAITFFLKNFFVFLNTFNFYFYSPR
jgi:hypothetical protein